MGIKKETEVVWNKLAQLYQEKFMNLDLYNESYDFFSNAITKRIAEILEIGCGPGNITKYILSKRPDFKLLGIDIAANMIDLARKNNPNAKFKVMDAREISKLEDKYDGIVCGFTLPYLSIEDSSKLISDCFDLLNEKGIIYISFVDGDSNNSGYKIGGTGDKIYFYYHSLDEIKLLLSKYKFKELSIFQVPYGNLESEKEIHTIIIAKK